MRTRLPVALLTAFLVTVLSLALAAPAQAVTASQRLAVAVAWTQATSPSQSAWNGARLNRAPWTAYTFDWSTDYCSASPDEPLGFDFRMPCARHDFGYRNFKAMSAFPSNKTHVDSAFYFDMKQVCARYPWASRATCLGLAWTYYEAVRKFGSLVVSQRQITSIAHNTAA